VDATVDLVDRVVTDVRMTVGQRGMESQTAGFSAEDLDKAVTVRGAGLLVTTIQAVTSPTVATLAAPAQRAVADGAVDVWRTDSRPGFEQLLAALAGLEVDSAEIRLGAGVYDFTRAPKVPNLLSAALRLDGLDKVTISGAGAGVTVIRLMPDQDLGGPDSHVIQARNCKKLTIRNLAVHGAYLTMAAVNEQMHGVVIGEGCEDVALERVEVFQSAGDGVRLLGAPHNKVRRVWVDGCRLVQNKRTGIAFQRAAEFVWVRDCYIEMSPPSTDACIDFEPTGQAAPTDVVIDSNVLVHDTPATAVSLSGITGGEPDPARRIRFTGNTLKGGVIGGVHAMDLTVTGNTIIAGDRGDVMVFRGMFDGLRIQDNRLLSAGAEQDGIRLSPTAGFGADGVRITGNDIEAAGVGIALVDVGSNVEVRGNRILGQGAAIGIQVSLTKPPDDTAPLVDVRRDVRIVSNTITNFADAGIQIATASTRKRLDGLEILGNALDVDATNSPGGLVGIRIPPPGNGTDRWLTRALISGNRIADAVATKVQRDVGTVPFVVVSGDAGDRAIFQGDGNPEEIGVAAPPGSLFLRVDEAPSAALYLKASGTGSSGWVEMARSS
jgi:hypothetical protein